MVQTKGLDERDKVSGKGSKRIDGPFYVSESYRWKSVSVAPGLSMMIILAIVGMTPAPWRSSWQLVLLPDAFIQLLSAARLTSILGG